LQEKKATHDQHAYELWQKMQSDWQLFGCTQGFEEKVKAMLRLTDDASVDATAGSKASEEEDNGKGPGFPIFLIYYRTTKGDLHADFVHLVKRAIAKQMGQEKKRRQSVISLYEGRVEAAEHGRRSSASFGGGLSATSSSSPDLSSSTHDVRSSQRKASVSVSMVTALKVASAMKHHAKESQRRSAKRNSHLVSECMTMSLGAGSRPTL
jgi:hypothetical protein